jgi:hypothetical protein
MVSIVENVLLVITSNVVDASRFLSVEEISVSSIFDMK